MWRINLSTKFLKESFFQASSEILAAAVSAAEDSDDHNDEHETEDIGELNGNKHDKNIVHRKVDKRVHYDIHDDDEL